MEEDNIKLQSKLRQTMDKLKKITEKKNEIVISNEELIKEIVDLRKVTIKGMDENHTDDLKEKYEELARL
jgi:uncharacterized membrane protein (DUF106 family)